MIEFEEKAISAAHPSIKHGFFGRQGGVSVGLYDSLNCAVGSDDDALSVQKNRQSVASQLIENADDIQTVWQIHSKECVVIEAPFNAGKDRPKADALVTDRAGLVIGVLTADCGPVLFACCKEDGSPVIGAVHAGWGGALKGVCEETVKVMINQGAMLESITAVIGPCIAPKSYEVSVGFEKPFLEQDGANEHFFKPASREGHLMFDLPGYIASRLARVGVKNVVISGIDTFSEEERFFSYRRTTHRKEPDYGRQVSAIAITE
ncbi:MAG: peptidoglycan editing factor PgeF [Alphaproteobacteria bacterium]|nr:peptidoglycan editing factor PgeF [Alphaproteobacteria bacterium]